MSLHPDLAALRARYDDLYASAAAGHITGEAATATLQALTVTDGTGAVWHIDIEGQYLRAEYPGAPTARTDAAAYVGPETVTSNPETGQYNIIGANPSTAVHAPADIAPPNGGFGAAAGTADNTFTSGAPGSAGGFGGGFGASATASADADPFAGPPIGRAVNEPPARSLHDTPRRRVSPAALGKVRDILAANKVLLVIVVLAAAFAVYSLTGSDADSATIPDPAAGAEANPAPAQPAPAAEDTTSVPAVAPALPDARHVTATVRTLTSGDRATIDAALAEPAQPQHLAEAAAFFAGLTKAGLRLEPSPLTSTGAGTAAGTWNIHATSTKNILVIPVSWTFTDGTWKLSSVPRPQ